MNRILFAALSITAATWISSAVAQDKGTVGISMPTKSSARWIADGDNLVKVFKEKGYKTDLQYADDDIPNQLAQIENMITKGSKVLVIAAIDGTTLSGALQKAADKGIKVIAYDRLIRGSKNVDYYTTFDNFQVGVLQATSIVDKLGLKQGKGPFNIELFGGSPDDNNAFFFYDGAMLNEIAKVADAITVLRDGSTITTRQGWASNSTSSQRVSSVAPRLPVVSARSWVR
jgi:putative multiple sugar transport system substrate-binding protein